jgi:hypothetical protein
MRVTFDNSCADFVVEALGHSLDEDGYILNKEGTARETTRDDEEIHIDKLGGADKEYGFFLNDVYSIMCYVEWKEETKSK